VPGLEEEVRAMGFNITKEVKILGIKITSELDSTDEIFRNVRQKIISLINFWERFKLTLPGRILIAKTFLISQLNYVGCFLTPETGLLTEIQEIIDSYCIKNLKVAKNRRYIEADRGGLELLNLEVLLDAQKASWVFRAAKTVCDNWRAQLLCLAPCNNMKLISEYDVNRNENPILFDIARSYGKFLVKFCMYRSPLDEIPIRNNPLVLVGSDKKMINGNLAGSDFDRAGLLFKDFFDDGNFKSRANLIDTGIPVTMAQWLNIRGGLLLAKKTY